MMLIDESKMAVDSSVRLLYGRKQHINFKLKTFYLKLKTKQNLFEQSRSTKPYCDRPIQIAQT